MLQLIIKENPMITSATEFLAVFAIHPALIAAMSRAANTSRTGSRRKNIYIPYSPLSALQIIENPPIVLRCITLFSVKEMSFRHLSRLTGLSKSIIEKGFAACQITVPISLSLHSFQITRKPL